MKDVAQPRLVAGRVAQVREGIWPNIVIAGNSKDVFVGIRSHHVAGCRELLDKPVCARITQDEEGFTVLIDIWQEGEPAPWEKDPDGDAVMMEWWGLGRRMA